MNPARLSRQQRVVTLALARREGPRGDSDALAGKRARPSPLDGARQGPTGGRFGRASRSTTTASAGAAWRVRACVHRAGVRVHARPTPAAREAGAAHVRTRDAGRSSGPTGSCRWRSSRAGGKGPSRADRVSKPRLCGWTRNPGYTTLGPKGLGRLAGRPLPCSWFRTSAWRRASL